ncbi:unnamed protein product [Orchesella dallaii]|uniref:C2H2-type domain-containing protein n=1 Tax=Orchesella dallaii TaxID=48710 RepID=A0ABP1QJ22_9HEXA
MTKNLCLVCCYVFQERRSRFISDETRQCFHRFCTDIGFRYENKEPGQPKSSSLDLPFGEAITVCGDCLSLIVFYVQRKSVQLEQEEKLEELQKAVVKALKDLSVVVKDVESHINELQTIMRNGDESSLHKFVKKCSRSGGDLATSFRDKILSVNEKNGDSVEIAQGYREGDMILPVLVSVPSESVKVEPVDFVEECNDSMYVDDYDDSSHLNDVDDDFLDSGTDGVVTTTRSSACFEEEPSFSKRSVRKSLTECQDSQVPEESSEDESNSDIDSDYDDAASNFSDDCKPAKRTIQRIRRKNRNVLKRARGRPRKVKVNTPPRRVVSEPSQSPEDWKNDLIGRILEQWGTSEDAPQRDSDAQSGSKESVTNVENQETETKSTNEEHVEVQAAANHMQIVDGELQFGGVKIRIEERHKALICVRCGKKFRDDTSKAENEGSIEDVVRNHIITKHPPRPPKKKLREIIEVTPYKCTSRKETYKIACKNMYRYDRRCQNPDGRIYFRCDDRKSNCGATILLLNGEYSRMESGWTNDGYHLLHPPNTARTEEQILLGKVKEYSLSNPTLTIHEVWDKFVKDSNGHVPISASRVRRILRFARYGNQKIPEEEKKNRIVHCPDCNKMCNGTRSLARHMNSQHKTSDTAEEGPRKAEVSPSEKIISSGKRKRTPKPANKKIKSDPGLSLNSSTQEKIGVSASASLPEGNQPTTPCGIFADSAQASNFVNRCITAIMQQVGIPVPPTNSLIPADRPAAPPSVAPSSVCENSSTTPSSPVHDQHESSSRTASFLSTAQSGGGAGSQLQRSGPSYSGHQHPGQWNQLPIPSHGQHHQSQMQLPTNSQTNQLQMWPWSAGSH